MKEALEGKEVIEYPIFHVVLSRHFSEYPTDISSPSKYFTLMIVDTVWVHGYALCARCVAQ